MRMSPSACFRLLLFLAFGTLLHCLNDDPASAKGGGSEDGNPMVVGYLYEGDGAPAKNAKVNMILSNQNPTINSLQAYSTSADLNGKFKYDSIGTGVYNVFAQDTIGNLSFQDSIAVVKGYAIDVPADTLKPAGRLKFVVEVQPHHDSRNIDVIFWGTDIGFVPIASNGTVEIDSLAEGKYPVRIKCAMDYNVLDTVFEVFSGKTTDLDTIELEYLGVPQPKNMEVRYDSLAQVVTLSWIAPDTSQISGFNVYRSMRSGNFVLLTPGYLPFGITTFNDTNFLEGITYEYNVVSRGNAGEESPKNDLPNDTVTIVSVCA